MDWNFPNQTDPEDGLNLIASRVMESVGSPLVEGSRLFYDAAEMLEASREIENAAESGTRLLVGFQVAEKMAREGTRYAGIVGRGVEVVAFGTGPRPDVDSRIQWVELPADEAAVENQWFLVIDRPEPLVFVGYEVSEPDIFGVGGISDERKRFAGFVTEDQRVVYALTDHLMGVAGRAETTSSV